MRSSYKNTYVQSKGSNTHIYGSECNYRINFIRLTALGAYQIFGP